MAYNDHLLPALAAKDPAAVEWAAGGARLTLESGGEIDLMTALRLSPTIAKRQEALRDRNLYEAATLLPRASLGRLSGTRLHEALEKFRTELWPSWRSMRAPPAYATRVDSCLWYALRAKDKSLTRQRLSDILLDFEATHLR